MLSVAPKTGPDGQLQLHASTVVINSQAVAIAGPSGSGKSSLALELMTRGAALLADDITWLNYETGTLIAHCPPTLSGKIEARGVGILNAVPAPPTKLGLLIDLGQKETDRIPLARTVNLLGQDVPLLHNPETVHFVSAILHYMTYGRVTDPAKNEDPDAK